MADGSIPRELNRVPLWAPDWGVPVISIPPVFAGGTTNARGDNDGTSDPLTIFTVTGTVVVRVFGVCTVNIAGAASTLELGIAGSTAGLIAQTTGTDIDAGELWHDATPDSGIELATVAPQRIIVNGADIIETVGTADVTSGQIYYVCCYLPITPDGTVTSPFTT